MSLVSENVNFSVPLWKMDEKPCLDVGEGSGKGDRPRVVPVIFSLAQGIPAFQGPPWSQGIPQAREMRTLPNVP